MNPAHCYPTENKFGTCLTAGFRPGGASHFLLLRQKKVSKEKATPGCAVGFADFPALLETGGGCGTRATPSDSPRPFSAGFRVARRSTRGPKDGADQTVERFIDYYGGPQKKTKNQYGSSNADAFPSPLRGAEQRRRAGEFGLPCLSRRRVQASRPAHRVAQGTGQRPAPTQGSPFLWLLSFGEAKESQPARQARNKAVD